jgi:prophage antirepressor-like protein
MSNLTQFAFQDNQVRVLMLDNNPWFVASDVCKVLDLNNISQALTRLKDYEKSTIITNDVTGRNQEMAIMSEPGLYRLILTSRKPEAEPFQDWVCQEVLPQIRKTGSYQVKPKSEIELLIESAQHLLKLQQEQERIKLEQQLQSQKMAELESLTHQHDSEIDRIFNPNGHYFSIMGYYNNHKLGAISLVEAAAIGKKVTAYCKSKGILITPMNDPRFGRVNTYPEDAISMFVN